MGNISGGEKDSRQVLDMLIKSEEKYRTTFDRISDAFVALDADWNYTYMNKKAAEIFNVDPAAIIGKHIWTEFPEGVGQPFHLAYEKAMKEQQYVYLEEYYPPYDLWFENHIYPSKDGLSIFFRDITKRKKTEEALRMSSQRMSYHLNNSPLAVIEWDKNLIIRAWSVRAENIFGWKEAEVINKHFNDFNLVFEEDASATAVIATELMTGAVDRNKGENRNNTKSGKVIYCQWFNSVLKDEQGNIQSILSLVQDVTENKKADLLLTGEKEVMQMIATEQPLNLILGTIALNFEKIYTNALCSILLLDDKGTHVKQGAGPSLPDAYNKGIDGEPIGPVAGSCGTAAYRKERVIVSDIANDPLWVNYRDFALSFGLKAAWSTPIMNKAGKVYGTFAVYYKECRSPDDTEIKLIERYTNTALIALERYFKDIELKESEERYRSLYENSNEAILLTKTDGSILSANPAACNMFGRSEEEICMLGRNGLVNHEDPRLVQALEERKRTGKMKGELTFVRKDGVIFPGEISSTVFTTLNGEERTSLLIRDISERKKAEHEIQKLATIVQRSPEFIGIAGLDAKVIYINEGGKKIVGLDRDVTTTSMWDYFAPRDLNKFQNEVIHAVQKNGRWTGDLYFRNFKTGERIPVLMDIFYVFDPGGKEPIAFATVTTDITERKKADLKIQKSEELFSSAFHASPAGILITRIADGKIIDANESFLQLFEFSREEAIGHTSLELNMLSGEERSKLIQEQLASGGLNNFELLSKTKSGKAINLLFSSKPLVIDSEACHITTLIDITKRKKAEDALTESNLSLSEAQRIAKIGSWTYYIDGDLKWSDNMYQLYGLPSKITTTSAQFFFELVHPDDREKMQQWMQASLAGDNPGEYEFRSKLPDGSIHYYSGSGEVIYDEENTPVYLQGTVQDITERRKAEDEILKTTEQLQQLTTHLQSVREEERKRIGREIHDELGQQLTAMQMDVIWVNRKIPDESLAIKSKLKSILSLLDGSNESVRKILNELRPTILDEHSLPEVLEWQGIQFTESTGIPLEFRNNEPLPKLKEEIINCIFRAYQETLTNITKYAGAGKVVTSLHIHNGNLILTVEDNGKGFNTAKVRDKKSFGLMGIKERVRSVNGNFELISSPGKGTKIIISIPVHPEQVS